MIKIQPITSSHYQISLPDQPIDIEAANVPAMMDALYAFFAPGQIELRLKANGFSAHSSIIDKALEMAGLSSFEAAQQTSTGKVIF